MSTTTQVSCSYTWEGKQIRDYKISIPLETKRKLGTETKPHYKIPSWLIGVYAGEVKSL